MISISVNGVSHSADVEPQTPLLWVLRDNLGLTGTKYGCGIGICGACSVQIDGKLQRSCTIAVSEIGDASVATIEGLSAHSRYPLQKAWIAEQVPQCGYCQSGMLMAADALLKQIPSPNDEQIDAAISNLCRCGTYSRIRLAIKRAARVRGERHGATV
ncbi:(2Fe-2S)-binding protein [Undibacterium sp. TS12]|nr:(2Fe-2S)-binding protein [Undibacterium sp. TS12]